MINLETNPEISQEINPEISPEINLEISHGINQQISQEINQKVIIHSDQIDYFSYKALLLQVYKNIYFIDK